MVFITVVHNSFCCLRQTVYIPVYSLAMLFSAQHVVCVGYISLDESLVEICCRESMVCLLEFQLEAKGEACLLKPQAKMHCYQAGHGICS